MVYIICFCFAVIFSIAAAVKFFSKSDNRLLLSGVGVFLSLFLLFIPIAQFDNAFNSVNSFIMSVMRVIKVFALEQDFITSDIDFGLLPEWFEIIYVLLFNILYLIAPLLTFGFILSFLGNITAYLRLIVSRRDKVYVFSCVNTRTLTLAEDISKKFRNATIVFCNSEEIEINTKGHIICLKGGITEVSLSFLRFANYTTIFMADDDENLNISNTIRFTDRIKESAGLRKRLAKRKTDDEGIDIYYFSSLKRAGTLLNGIGTSGLRIRRINEVQSVVYNLMYNEPVIEYKNENNEINIAVIGFGNYGEEYVKAAVWSGQHENYKLNINIFDIQDVKSSFLVKCPELVETENLSDKDEVSYKLKFFDETDIFKTRFENIPEMKSTSAVFIALGDDELNFDATLYLRECFERLKINPKIYTVLTSIGLGEKDSIDITNHKRQPYNISFILPEKIYTYENILNVELEKMGKKMYLTWCGSTNGGTFDDFYNYEFNYRSSIAASTFWEIRKKHNQNIEVSDKNQRLEHWRWNAYMRSEGFRYAPERNDIAKEHHNLVPYDELDEKTKSYDAYPIMSVSKDDKKQ